VQEPPLIVVVINIPGHDQLLLLYWENILCVCMILWELLLQRFY